MGRTKAMKKEKILSVPDRKAYSYADYMGFTEKLIAEGRTTGPIQSDAMVHYTKMNLVRMQRLNKTIKLDPILVEAVEVTGDRYSWTIITEPWCGDAAQNVPVLAALAAQNPGTNLTLVLRDDNLDLMDRFLTNGGRSIPKLLICDKRSGDVVATWGPRPALVQQMVMDYKKMDHDSRPPYTELVEVLQNWYNKDKNRTLQQEMLDVLKALIL